VPFIPLQAAAGNFGEPQYFTQEEHRWVRYTGGRKLRPGMFVAQVVGCSMEPAIPDGSYCLFQAPVEGSRQGKTVLVALHSDTDPESGERYTVKRYTSQRATDGDGTWSHMTITLHPANPEFQPIRLTADDEGTVGVVAEMVEVL
jgi:SOS-response transcriptional repressor LexA